MQYYRLVIIFIGIIKVNYKLLKEVLRKMLGSIYTQKNEFLYFCRVVTHAVATNGSSLSFFSNCIE